MCVYLLGSLQLINYGVNANHASQLCKSEKVAAEGNIGELKEVFCEESNRLA